MEGFSAQLTSHRLSFLMPVLLEQPQFQGSLEVRRGETRRTFYLRDGWLEGFASTRPGEQLAQTLVDRGVLDPSAAAAAYDTAVERGRSLGELLACLGLVPSAVVREVLAERAQQGLTDCYGWESGEVEWRPGARLPEGLALRLRLRSLHDEALAAWRQFREALERFGGLGVRVKAAPEAQERCDPRALGMVVAAKAGPTLDELLGEGDGRLDAARQALALHRLGLLFPAEEPAPTPAAELRRARACLDAGQYEQAGKLASTVLARWPVPEAQQLFREAEGQAAALARRELSWLERRLSVEPFDRRKARSLTAADLYVYRRLVREQTVAGAFRQIPELSGYRSLRRLVEAGLVRVSEAAS